MDQLFFLFTYDRWDIGRFKKVGRRILGNISYFDGLCSFILFVHNEILEMYVWSRSSDLYAKQYNSSNVVTITYINREQTRYWDRTTGTRHFALQHQMVFGWWLVGFPILWNRLGHVYIVPSMKKRKGKKLWVLGDWEEKILGGLQESATRVMCAQYCWF